MPALVINTNVPSINGQRNLYKSTGALTKSMERLSSGLRINRAGDDAAGLAIAENLQTRVRGYNMAIRNCNDGISLINTAEGAVSTYTSILQRMRELAVQASSDVNSDQNRAAIQLEVDEQLKELQRIAETLDFNGQNLFDGTFIDRRIQVGARPGEWLDISCGDLRTNIVGAQAWVDGNSVSTTAPIAAGAITITGSDGVAHAIPSTGVETSAIAKAAAIESISDLTGVNVEVRPTTVTGTAAVQTGTLDSTNYITINGVQIGSASSIAVVPSDYDGSLRQAINAVREETGVTASIGNSGQLVLTAEDGRNITIAGVGTGLTTTRLTAATTGGSLRLYSRNTFVIGGATAATALGVPAANYGINYDTAIDSIDITTFSSAQDSIMKIDSALEEINEIRAELGALTNRMENTVSNMMISSENLTAAESRIRDADFAVETANMTRAQILQQSGVAVLAQANTVPQAALTLLQG